MAKLKNLEDNLNLAAELSRRSGKSSVLVIQQFPVVGDVETLVPQVRESIANIIAFVELGDTNVLLKVLELADGKVDAIILDADNKLPQSTLLVQSVSGKIKNSKLFYYSDTDTWAEAAFHFITAIEGNLADKSIVLAGTGPLHYALLHKLKLLVSGIQTTFIQQEVDIVIGASYKHICITGSLEKYIKSGARVYDIGIGNFSLEQLQGIRNKTSSIYRFDNRAGISSLVLAKLETDHLINRVMGKTVLKGINIIAGGIMGNAGDVVVDDIKNPSYVIGIADGAGFLRTKVTSESEQQNLHLIRSIIE